MSLRDELERDLKDVIGTDADAATYVPVMGLEYPVRGWLSSNIVDNESGSYMPMPAKSQKFTVRTSAIVGGVVKKDDELILNGIRYKIKEGRPDVRGTTDLLLMRP
jgi:hypothetical protein